jgi:hypothetical protein
VRLPEDVEMPVKGNLVADLGLVMVNPASGTWGNTSRSKYASTSSLRAHSPCRAGCCPAADRPCSCPWRPKPHCPARRTVAAHGDGAVAEALVLEDAADGRPHSSLGYRPPAPSAWQPEASQGYGKVERKNASHFSTPRLRRRAEYESRGATLTLSVVQITRQPISTARFGSRLQSVRSAPLQA